MKPCQELYNQRALESTLKTQQDIAGYLNSIQGRAEQDE